ncbi:MAG: glycosyltransferase family 4 protein [Ardenticatenia bacterium]|nr:glycosyltransferase family 4 protein [Ardenticatenia bacterium]
MPVPFSGSIARISVSPRVYPAIKALLNQHSFDIIHIHEPTVPTLAPAILRYSRSVNVGTFHAYRDANAGFELAKPIFGYMERLHGRIAVSKVACEYISTYFPGEYRIIPNGIEYARFASPDIHPVERFWDGRPNLLFVGRLEERKGFRYLLRAFRTVKAAVPEARLLVVGAFEREDTRPYIQYAWHYRVRGVHFIGYVSGEELPRWYRTAHLFCAPSTGFESFGIVLLEAMAAGVAVVASDIPGYRCVVEQGVQGEFVPPANDEALAQTIIRLLRDPERRRQYGEAGRRTAARYDWGRVTEEILAYYDELLKRPGN